MSRTLLLALALLLTLAVGWLLGASGIGPGRAAPAGATARRAPGRDALPDAREVERLRLEARRAEALAAENEALRERVRQLADGPPPAEAAAPEEGPAPGTRRPDGTIVGGARWPDLFVRTATGYLEQLMSEFLEEADLDAEQEKRLREQLHIRIEAVMAISADFTNGDVTGEDVYERMTAIAREGRARSLALLNDEQAAVYRKFERRLTDQMRDQIVHGELVTLTAELRLDPDQEAKVRAAISDRWRRVEERIGMPVPNVMFRPIRRGTDADIYRETAETVRQFLTPEQELRFDREERVAGEAVFTYRSMLVPKSAESR